MCGLLLPAQHWECARCSVTDVTTGETNRYHQCAGLAGVLAPLVPAGSGARIRAVEREDYVGGEIVVTDGNGTPVMAVITERPDGSNDVMINVPTARATGGAS